MCSTCSTGYQLSNNACLLTSIGALNYPDNCYLDTGSDRDLPHQLAIPSGLPDSIVWCRSQCGGLGYVYAGVQYTHQCFCGNSFGKHGIMPNSDCSRSCQETSSGNKCGGASRNNVYYSTGLVEHEFNTCGSSGTNGPSINTCKSKYSDYDWVDDSGVFYINKQGYQEWTVETSGIYTIEAYGARGGNPRNPSTTASYPGKGAYRVVLKF